MLGTRARREIPPWSDSLLSALSASPRRAISRQAQDLGAADPTGLELAEGLVRVFERVLLHLGTQRNARGQRQKLGDIGAGDVGDALDLALHPQVLGVVELEESALVALLLANGVDDQATAGREVG